MTENLSSGGGKVRWLSAGPESQTTSTYSLSSDSSLRIGPVCLHRSHARAASSGKGWSWDRNSQAGCPPSSGPEPRKIWIPGDWEAYDGSHCVLG